MAVDPELGHVEIRDYVVVEDGGVLVNPMIVDGQVCGGAAQGIGTALYEEMPFDAQGQPLASTLADYLLPGPVEIPDLRIFHMETPSPYTEFGQKGIGESGAIGPPAAIGNAKQIVNKVFGRTLTRTIRAGEAMNANQRIRTGRDSAADILFLDDTTLFVGELTSLVLDELVYDAAAAKVSGSLELLKGILRFASAPLVQVDLNIKTVHGGFGIRGTAFDLLTSAAATEIAVHEGQVAIQTPFGNANVGAGEVYQLTAAAGPAATRSTT